MKTDPRSSEKKAAASALEDNEKSMRAPVTLHPPAGDYHPAKPGTDPAHNGEACWDEFVMGTPTLLGKAFDEYRSSAKKDKAFIAENFSSRDYESHSPLLRKYAQAGLVPSGASLNERTRNLIPR